MHRKQRVHPTTLEGQPAERAMAERPASPRTAGAALKASRKAAGMTQHTLSQRAGVSREAVQYWEAKPNVPLRYGAPRAIADVLGLPTLAKNLPDNARAGGWGDTGLREKLARLDAWFDAQMALWREREEPSAKPAAAWSAGPRRARVASVGQSQRLAAGVTSFTAGSPPVRERPKTGHALPRRKGDAGRRGELSSRRLMLEIPVALNRVAS